MSRDAERPTVTRKPRTIRGRFSALRIRIVDGKDRLFEIKAVWMFLFLFVLTLLLLGPHMGPDLPGLPVGSVVPEDIIAPVSLEYVDDEATEEVREAARATALPVYDFDSASLTRSIEVIRRTFDQGLQALSDLEQRRGDTPLTREALRGLLLPSEEVQAPEAALEYLGERRFNEQIKEHLVAALRAAYAHRIVGSKALLAPDARATLRDTFSGREWKEAGLREVRSLDEARDVARASLRAASVSEERTLAPFLADLITPNLILNGALTEARREEAGARIEPLIVRIPKGKVILRSGEVVNEDAARTLEGFHAARRQGRSVRVLLGNLLFTAILVFFMSRYVFFYQRSYRRERHLFALLVVVMVINLLIDRAFMWLINHVVDTLQTLPYADPSFYRFMMPMAGGAILMTLLGNARIGMAYALFYLPLFGMVMEWDPPLLLFCLISNLAAIYGITQYRQRTALIQAGLMLGAVNMITVLALHSVIGSSLPPSHVFYLMLCAFIGGVLVAALTSFLLPLLESFFNILTDVRLLELSNLNNPLLRRLAVEAPGSYNHSVIVGTLAESAAEVIGANTLFCRVAAYYHDVGKMLKPHYFVENQRDRVNRHDALNPHMSALVIASHVKEGYELAKSYGLPKQVLDIIPQHHGTRKINFFYEKAKKHENPDLEEVRESDYRYPGPKPQSREAAIFMLADSIEAAARTLDDPSPPRFKGLIRKIVSDVVLDDQFSQCDLTFSDLEKVSGAFLKTLGSIYHHRIEYPGFDFDKVVERPFKASRTHEPARRTKEWGS